MVTGSQGRGERDREEKASNAGKDVLSKEQFPCIFCAMPCSRPSITIKDLSPVPCPLHQEAASQPFSTPAHKCADMQSPCFPACWKHAV